LLAHLLAVMALAALPKVHDLVHGHPHDHDHDHVHECAVTVFLQGGYSASVATPIIIGAMAWTLQAFIRPSPVWVESLFLSRSVLEHAPPVS
jgi:hypothetical protein